MNRFSVIYLLEKEYYHICCALHSEADTVLEQLMTQEDHTPLGIYDAKTELFYWEPNRQRAYNQASIEQQGKHGGQMIQLAQALRQQNKTYVANTDVVNQVL